MGKKLEDYPKRLWAEMGNGLGGVLPQSDVHNPQQHNKIDTIGGNLKIKIKEAVKGNGDQAA